MSEVFEKIVNFTPAFDGRPGSFQEWRTAGMKPSDGTSKTNYGIGGVDIHFVLKGSKGAMVFSLLTDWYPPHVQDEQQIKSQQHFIHKPFGSGVDYHSPKPRYEGQRASPGECKYVPKGCSCYCDGSSLLAQEWVDTILLKEGSEGVWKALEARYYEYFGV